MRYFYRCSFPHAQIEICFYTYRRFESSHMGSHVSVIFEEFSFNYNIACLIIKYNMI